MHLAAIAMRELEQDAGSWTQAARDRLGRVRAGLEWLDNDQATVRARIEDTLAAFATSGDVVALTSGLRALVQPTPEQLEPRQRLAQRMQRIADRLEAGRRRRAAPPELHTSKQ